jgi:hypothetical protein
MERRFIRLVSGKKASFGAFVTRTQLLRRYWH